MPISGFAASTPAGGAECIAAHGQNDGLRWNPRSGRTWGRHARWHHKQDAGQDNAIVRRLAY
ncbi:hypothetical protein [Ralstonia syzygii]|uniref:hypothetical protein n=1 Tax=Ralstonia syzygii TaxID=28097 RepID=UPI0036F34DAC